jgi:DNA-binding transcriptional ArsR family regulator
MNSILNAVHLLIPTDEKCDWRYTRVISVTADMKGTIMYLPSNSIEIQAKLFRGFSDPSRLSILVALLHGALTVSEIVEATGLTQSNASNHLACLRDCGLVTAEQRGRFVHYELSDPRVGQLLVLADELLGHVAQGVYQCTRYDVNFLQHG